MLAKALLLALAALAVAGPLSAQIPAQEGWAEAGQSVTTDDGQTLSYVEMGPQEGMSVILLHGYTDNSRSWSLLAPHLDGRRLIAMDLRGHGGSEAPACCYGLDSLSHDLLGFMDALEIEKVDLVGHSLGSMTAGVFAALHPERANRMVLISTALRFPDASTEWLWDNVPALPDPIDPDSQFMLDWYWNPNPVDTDFLSRERAESAATPPQVWMGVLKALTMTDWSAYAARVETPVLTLWGDQDGFFDATSQDEVRETFPEARHEKTFEGYGHNLFWEIPQQTGALITGFLAN